MKKPIAFQGELGAFSQAAVYQLFGGAAPVLPCSTFEIAFRSLSSGKAAAAVIPIENTLAGSVHENYDHLLRFNVRIVAETNVRIVHNLITRPGVRKRDIKRVYSHPVALNQCLKFFERNPRIERIPFYDTAGSVKMIMSEGLEDAAAIASEIAAGTYGAHILKAGIEDDRRNFTRFFRLQKIGAKAPAPRGQANWKTSVVFTTRNKPGTLFRGLSAFALRDVNLTKIESRPLRGKPWEYLFYLDFDGRQQDANVGNALRHLSELADFIRVLGTYPAAEG